MKLAQNGLVKFESQDFVADWQQHSVHDFFERMGTGLMLAERLPTTWECSWNWKGDFRQPEANHTVLFTGLEVGTPDEQWLLHRGGVPILIGHQFYGGRNQKWCEVELVSWDIEEVPIRVAALTDACSEPLPRRLPCAPCGSEAWPLPEVGWNFYGYSEPVPRAPCDSEGFSFLSGALPEPVPRAPCESEGFHLFLSEAKHETLPDSSDALHATSVPRATSVPGARSVQFSEMVEHIKRL